MSTYKRFKALIRGMTCIALAWSLIAEADQAPNVLLVVVDDMGFSDLGAFGASDIETPNLDAIAREGVRFSDFQVMPACSLTRAAMLTGADPQQVGFGSLAEELSDNQIGKPAYRGYLPEDLVTLPMYFRRAGYRTMMSGKWHLGFEDERGPKHFGFDSSFAMLSGGASHFRDALPAYSPDPNAIAPYTLNDVKLSALPDDFEYSSQFYVDQLIRFLEGGGAEDSTQPFFAYLAFTAPHWPLQAPEATINKYIDKYTAGYEAQARDRFEGLKREGLIPAAQLEALRPPKMRSWVDLNEAERAREIRSMAVYAAMIDEIDQHIGRLRAYLERKEMWENTIVVFFSDNGPEGHDLDETWSKDLFPKIRAQIDARFDHSTERAGMPGSYTLYGAGWAFASQPHLRMYKGFPSEGGTRVAAFAKVPEGKGGGVYADTVSVKDVLPTLLDLAEIDQPDAASPEITGVSKATAFNGVDSSNALEATPRGLGVELFGKKAYREGCWKVLELPPPYGSGEFGLYNICDDISERVNLAEKQPAIFARLKAGYQSFAKANGIIEPDWVSGY